MSIDPTNLTNHPQYKLAAALAALCGYVESIFTTLPTNATFTPRILVARDTDPYVFPLPEYPGDIPNFPHLLNNHILPGILDDPTTTVNAIAVVAQGKIAATPDAPEKTPALLLTHFTPNDTIYLVWPIDPITRTLTPMPEIANFHNNAPVIINNPFNPPPPNRTLN